MTKAVVFLAFDSAMALDITGPIEVLAMANRLGGGVEYDLEVVSKTGGVITAASGVRFLTTKMGDSGDIDTLIVSGGLDVATVAKDPQTSAWVQEAAARSRRICSVCTGAFILAEAGLLDGRRAATHWGSGADFREKYPHVELDLKPIFVRDGPVWTSAGLTAGIDLALALVEDDLGRSLAIRIAKQLVVFLRRPGGQAQFSSTLTAQSRAVGREIAERFRGLHAWMVDNLAGDLSVSRLADKVNMAPRSFARLYGEEMGVTPARAVEDLRLEAAKRSLEAGSIAIKEVAASCGFGNEERLRRSFQRRYSVSPSAYRERFGVSHRAGGTSSSAG